MERSKGSALVSMLTNDDPIPITPETNTALWINCTPKEILRRKQGKKVYMVPIFQKEANYLYKQDNSFNWKRGESTEK